MTTVVIVVFIGVYAGMLLGRFPGLQMERTGIVLLGTIALLATGVMDLNEAVQALHMPTLVLLFALMVVSAQLRLGGFYTRVTQVLTRHSDSGHAGSGSRQRTVLW